jgi:hypothetical protein
LTKRTVIELIVISLILCSAVPGALAAKPETTSLPDTIADLQVKVANLRTLIDEINTLYPLADQALQDQINETRSQHQSDIDNLKIQISNIPAGPQGPPGPRGERGATGPAGPVGATVHLGEWTNGWSFNQTYTAPTDGFVVVYGSNPLVQNPPCTSFCYQGSVLLEGWTPQDIRIITTGRIGGNYYDGFTMPVRAGDTWRVTETIINGYDGSDCIINWIPLTA